MNRSDRRILTTHTGSLPRSPELTSMMVKRSKREPVEAIALEAAIEASTARCVANQIACGIDVGNDGEQSRESFITYVQHRLSGFGGESRRPVMRDIIEFPSFLTLRRLGSAREVVSLMNSPMAVSEVRHVDRQPLEAECDRLRRIVDAQPDAFAEPFMTAASPGIIAAAMLNEHYASDDAYVLALADALRPEYEHIVAQGFVLQIDCPDLAMERHTSYADRPLSDFLAYVERNIAAMNRALSGLPRDRIRFHVCWGNYEGPHHHDVPMRDVLPLLYAAHASAIVLPFANPRHAHEWRCLAEFPPPDDWLVVVGVIDTTTNYVEHPEVVADRIENVARALGDPSRVLAGTDCGFDTSAGLGEVAEEVVWEKMKALRAGADIASARLFGG